MKIRTRRLGAGVAALTALAALTGCSSGTEPSSTSSDSRSAKDLSIGVFIQDTSNAYLQAYQKGAEEEAKKLGVKVTVIGSGFDAQKQANTLSLALARKTYDAWIVSPVAPKQQCSAIKKAAATGLPVIIVVTPICGDDGYTTGTTGFVGEQNRATYDKWFDYILKNTDAGKIAVLTGPPLDYVTDTTTASAKAAVAANSKFSIASLQNTDYSTEKAFDDTQAVLKANPDLKAVASNYVGMTRGVVQAVKAAGLTGKVKVYDLDGDSWSKQRVQDGTIAMTIPGTPYTDMTNAVQQTLAVWQGKKIATAINPLDKLSVTDPPIITKANVGEWTPEY